MTDPRLRRHPLNLLAERALAQAQVAVNPHYYPIVQWLLWWMSQQANDPQGYLADAILCLEELQRRSPRQALAAILPNQDDLEEDLEDEEAQPKEVLYQHLNQLHQSLAEQKNLSEWGRLLSENVVESLPSLFPSYDPLRG